MADADYQILLAERDAFQSLATRLSRELACLQQREVFVKELCDWASEAREFFGDDISDIDAYTVAHHLGEAERAVRNFGAKP